MRFSHRYKFIYFANPKTGTSTVRGLLEPFSDNMEMIVDFPEVTVEKPFHPHMRPLEARQVFHRLGWDFDGYFRFTTVRNPWARLVSLYSHIRRVEPDFLMGFGAWLGTISTGGAGGGGKPKAMWRRYGTYSIDNYVNDETGTPLVHEILRMEDLATLPAWLEGRGIPIAKDTEVRQVNAFAHSPQAFYTHRTIAQVARLYADDIARFGYAYEP